MKRSLLALSVLAITILPVSGAYADSLSMLSTLANSAGIEKTAVPDVPVPAEHIKAVNGVMSLKDLLILYTADQAERAKIETFFKRYPELGNTKLTVKNGKISFLMQGRKISISRIDDRTVLVVVDGKSVTLDRSLSFSEMVAKLSPLLNVK